jgi:hypothetical protein
MNKELLENNTYEKRIESMKNSEETWNGSKENEIKLSLF